MTARKVLVLPHALLEQPATPLAAIDDTARSLGRDLVDTMRASPSCVGIAAPQIGVSSRAFCVDVSGHPKARSCHGVVVMFNPVLVEVEKPEVAREGCMSVPDLTGDVARATRVVMEGLDMEGHRFVLEADAFEARALLHELDHLDGLVFLDRVAGPSAVFRRRVYR